VARRILRWMDGRSYRRYLVTHFVLGVGFYDLVCAVGRKKGNKKAIASGSLPARARRLVAQSDRVHRIEGASFPIFCHHALSRRMQHVHMFTTGRDEETIRNCH